MLKRFAALLVVCGAFLAFAAPAGAFSIEHPVSGECHQVLLPMDAFPGNWEVVSTNGAMFPGPWNAHLGNQMRGNDNTALGPVECPQG
jgi:hypothetical protein